MAKQETLTLFPEVENVTRKMTDAQFGSLIRAVMAYRFRGEAYEGDDIAVDIAFQFISSQVDRSETAKAAKTSAAKNRWSMQSDAEPMQSDAGGMQNHAEGMHSDAEPMQSDAPIQSSPILSSPILSSPDKNTADSPPAPTRQAKKSFGVYGWVKLTDDEFNRLINDLGEAEANRCIAYVDESAQGNGNCGRKAQHRGCPPAWRHGYSQRTGHVQGNGPPPKTSLFPPQQQKRGAVL